jgi:hypothetical protein
MSSIILEGLIEINFNIEIFTNFEMPNTVASLRA